MVFPLSGKKKTKTTKKTNHVAEFFQKRLGYS